MKECTKYQGKYKLFSYKNANSFALRRLVTVKSLILNDNRGECQIFSILRAVCLFHYLSAGHSSFNWR